MFNARQTSHQCSYNNSKTFLFIDIIRQRHFLYVFNKCREDLLRKGPKKARKYGLLPNPVDIPLTLTMVFLFRFWLEYFLLFRSRWILVRKQPLEHEFEANHKPPKKHFSVSYPVSTIKYSKIIYYVNKPKLHFFFTNPKLPDC